MIKYISILAAALLFSFPGYSETSVPIDEIVDSNELRTEVEERLRRTKGLITQIRKAIRTDREAVKGKGNLCLYVGRAQVSGNAELKFTRYMLANPKTKIVMPNNYYRLEGDELLSPYLISDRPLETFCLGVEGSKKGFLIDMLVQAKEVQQDLEVLLMILDKEEPSGCTTPAVTPC